GRALSRAELDPVRADREARALEADAHRETARRGGGDVLHLERPRPARARWDGTELERCVARDLDHAGSDAVGPRAGSQGEPGPAGRLAVAHGEGHRTRLVGAGVGMRGCHLGRGCAVAEIPLVTELVELRVEAVAGVEAERDVREDDLRLGVDIGDGRRVGRFDRPEAQVQYLAWRSALVGPPPRPPPPPPPPPPRRSRGTLARTPTCWPCSTMGLNRSVMSRPARRARNV